MLVEIGWLRLMLVDVGGNSGFNQPLNGRLPPVNERFANWKITIENVVDLAIEDGGSFHTMGDAGGIISNNHPIPHTKQVLFVWSMFLKHCHCHRYI